MVPPRLALYFLPVVLLLIAGEIYLYHRNHRRFPWVEAGISLLMTIIYHLVNHQSLLIIAPINEFFYNLRLFTFRMDSVWSWVLLFFAEELAYYWLHRCGHEIRWFWASHSVHHSPTEITLSGAYRLGFTGAVTGLLAFLLPLYVLGFPVKAVATMFGINLLYQFWLHTDWIPQLGWLEWLLNTPSHHRVHHSINDEYIDKNYGGIVIFYDLLFGTFAKEKPGVTLKYGLIGKAPTRNLFKLFFQEWVAIAKDVRQARSLREALTYTFGRPGWKPKEPSSEALPSAGVAPSAMKRRA